MVDQQECVGLNIKIIEKIQTVKNYKENYKKILENTLKIMYLSLN